MNTTKAITLDGAQPVYTSPRTRKPTGRQQEPLNASTQAMVVRDGGHPVTTSRIIAKVFGKQHTHVLKAIDRTVSDASNRSFTEAHFRLSEYRDSTGRSHREWILTEEGFTAAVLGFTGQRALDLRIAFVQEFAKVKERIAKLDRDHPEWIGARSDAAEGSKAVMLALEASRKREGKATEPHHFRNEAVLINFAMTGEAMPTLDRTQMSREQLTLLHGVELLDIGLLISGEKFSNRKAACRKFVLDRSIALNQSLRVVQ